MGQVEKITEIARPIAVRMVEAVRPETKPLVPTPPKPVPRSQPRIHQPQILVSHTPAASSTFTVAEQPIAPQPVVEPAPVVETVTHPRFDADYLTNPKPTYPPASRKLREEGTVYLRVHVDTDGRAIEVELKKSSGISRLDQSALDTVSKWRFVPARRGNIQVASWVVVPIVFSLT
ncbi:MAG: TonB family protein [Azonexus sp.]|nr:TonB family protein [Azonexus sp.]